MEAATQRDEQQTDDRQTDGDGKVGSVEEIQGVVVEVTFPGHLPEIYNALEVELDAEGDEEGQGRLILEVQQHLGDDRVRAVAMDATDGLSRGARVRDTGGPITVPVGRAPPGGNFNPPGETIDEGGGGEGGHPPPA